MKTRGKRHQTNSSFWNPSQNRFTSKWSAEKSPCVETFDHWLRIREHLPEEGVADSRPGRKPVPARRVHEAVPWVLIAAAQWHRLRQCYSHDKTLRCRFEYGCQNEVLRAAQTDPANALRDERGINATESFIDATFASANGGGEQIGKTKRGNGVKIMAIVDRHDLPQAVGTHAANHHEVTLLQ